MPRMLIVDTYYPEAIDTIVAHEEPPQTYDYALRRVLSWQFGTGDFYSRHLRDFGWEVQDVIVNFPHLQSLWAQDRGISFGPDILDAQIEEFKPDVIFMQNLGFVGPAKLDELSRKYMLVGQCSCALRRELIPYYRFIFTSFPHFVRKYSGQPYCKFVYNPLAFEPSVLDGVTGLPERDLDISFVGGVGSPSHWNAGMNMLEAVATEFPSQFNWWGYGIDTLPPNSMLRRCCRGYAWGRDMYNIYSRSKIVINRHGEIAERYANNMRMYEATGCGALLMTEDKQNLSELFEPNTEVIPYRSPEHLIDQLHHFLEHAFMRTQIARNGQHRTMCDHTYRERMKIVSDTLLEML